MPLRLFALAFQFCLSFLGAMAPALFAANAVAAPQRIISTHLCTDEYVFRLVPRNRIEALSYLAGDTHPVVSTIADKVNGIRLIRPSAEEVLTLAPDLVVLYEGTNPRLKTQLAEMRIPFIEIPWADSLAQIREVTTRLGKEFGEPERAKAMLSEMDKQLSLARSTALGLLVPTLIYEPSGYATAGGVTDEILSAAGLSNAAASMGTTRSGTIPIETVVAAAPQLLILNGGARHAMSQADFVLQHPALRLLDAKTLTLSATLTPLLCPGPWSASVAPALAEMGARVRHRQGL